VAEKDMHTGSRWHFLKLALGRLAIATVPVPPESSYEVMIRC